ncbi:uncharacterized protein LOC133186947 [Saccostrea echinata]|uniref:uncharacterized protein LOC133186947 n=1 Tax=Saccostrea echinata TaxID=191078 RepID=UPI002A7F3D7D|nr:uncharacterized protein LOC133186947 [Saccostrea echinata]
MSSILWHTLLICCVFHHTFSFPPNDIPAEPKTQSHNSITLEAIFRTTAVFLDTFGLVNNTGLPPSQKVQEFFGTDQESYLNYLRIITRIIGYENNIQRDFADVSFYHVNGEQIAIAHNYIRNLRQTIKGLSQTATTDDIEQIREKIGAALYTIQEFYSNTNWVELRRNGVYEDFGQDGVTLIEVADLQENTCTDCAFLEGLVICDNNVVVDKLTSGYKSGQDVTKPVRQGISGKCSHGTSDDDSRFMTATGGIYKGRYVQSEAPRSILHGAASEAAINATQYFLIGQGRGLLSLIGEEVFRDVFGIRTREEIVKTSLTFVIDVTGSMGDDIAAVVKATKKIVYEAKDSQFVPENYILVTFSDPASLTTGRETDNPEIMVNWLQSLSVTGGGDCPEFAMTGMLKGIEMSNKNSKIYLCTDADAKDEYLQDQVIEGLREKSLTPVFLLTGQCSSRRKRDINEQSQISQILPPLENKLTHRVKRSSLQVFEAIAKETGGRVYETKVAQLETIVEKEIKDTFPSSNVFITWFLIPDGSSSNEVMSIPVDNHMETLKIVVRKVASQSEFTFSYPNGTNVMFLSENELYNILDNTLTISIKEPGPGIWKFKKNTSNAWIVNITAQSPMDFSASILEPSTGGNLYQLSGNPIKGYNYTLVVDIQNLDSNSSCTSVGLLDRNGTEVAEIPVTRLTIEGIARCVGDFVPINKSSYAQIRGIDALGNKFLRTSMFTILPASVQLRIYPVLGQLRLNESTNISFSLTNTGDSTVNFMITVSNGKTNITVQPGNLSSGEVYNAVAMLTPDSLQPVADTRTADCTVLKYPDRCPVQSLNTGNCSSYNWTGLVQVSSATIWLSDISASTDEVRLEHMNVSEANFSVPITISGICCIQAVVLTITDNDGKFDRCNFILSEQPLFIVQDTTTTEAQTTEFYSNTNWIELRGNVVYEDFGQDNVPLVEVADLKEDTCTNCEYKEGLAMCDNNLVADKLTSGYKSGQDVTKPVRQGLSGKCSHGTQDDESRLMTATGGIYKGRSVQSEAPHSNFHRAAAEAAISATQYFLVDPDRGLLSLMGGKVFRDVFGIRSREDVVKTSLTFVIDVTGSMGDNIKEVIKGTQKIVNEARDSQFVPENYILVTFSDPASLTTGRKTTDPHTMITWLQNLKVDGGDDCPEYALTGLLKGIEMSNENSKIYIYTDADAKDEELLPQVDANVKAKSIKPIFILTGQCSTRKKREIQVQSHESLLAVKNLRTHRKKRSSLKVFQAIAEKAGGKVIQTKVGLLGAIVEKEIKETFPSSNVFVTWFVIPGRSMSNENYSIHVDNGINTLKIFIKNVSTESEFSLHYPNGSDVTFSSQMMQQSILDNILTFTIRDPVYGIWILRRNMMNAYIVNVTAQSPLDFSASILELSTGGNSFQLSGNPIKGRNYRLVVDVQNLDSNSSCSSAGLLDNNGDIVNEIPLTRIAMAGIASFIGDFIPLRESSYVQIRGTDEFGSEFLRSQTFSILPVSVQLRISPVLGYLRLNEGRNISFTLSNTGNTTVLFVITVSDRKTSTNISVQSKSLDAGQIFNGAVMVTPRSLKPILLQFSVTLENYTGVIQTETRRYFVSDTRRAQCTVLNRPEMCPIESLNTGNCSTYNWTGLVKVSSATMRLSEIRVSNDEVVLEHSNFSDANSSLSISIRGHCCVQSVVLTITDKNGYFDQCNFVLSTQPLSLVQTITVPEETTKREIIEDEKVETTDNWKIVGIVIGSSVAGIILVAIFVIIFYKTKKGTSNKQSYQLVRKK